MNDKENSVLYIQEGKKEEVLKRIERINENILNFGFDGKFTFSGEKTKITDKMRDLNVPGVCIAVINNFELEWIKCYGIKDARTNEPLTLDCIFEIGSASKTFTALTALELVSKGKLDLKEDVNNKLRTWKIPSNKHIEKTKISLDFILSHRSGINGPKGGFSSEPNSKPSLEQMFNGEKPSLSEPLIVEYEPGTNHSYSNYGYILVQMLLQDVEHRTFHDIVNENIFEPLKMKNSWFVYPIPEMRKKMPVPHDQNGEAKEPGLSPSAFAQGGLIISPFDLATFYISLMKIIAGEGDIELSKYAVEKLVSPVLKLDPTKFFGMTGQGLGIFSIDNGKNIFYTHPGTNWPGATCLPIFCSQTGQGAIIFTNGIQGELLQNEIMNSIAREYNWSLWEY